MHGFWRAALYLAALGILAHPVGQALPRSCFDPQRFPYRCGPWEKNGRIYERLGVRRWKNKVPDMSRLLPDMVKKRLGQANTLRLIQETCAAECIHWWLLLLSVGILPLWRSPWCWVLWLLYNLLGNLPYIIIQRYNRPRLLRLAEKEKRRS